MVRSSCFFRVSWFYMFCCWLFAPGPLILLSSCLLEFVLHVFELLLRLEDTEFHFLALVHLLPALSFDLALVQSPVQVSLEALGGE